MLVPIVVREGVDGIDAIAVTNVLVAASFTASGAIAWARRPASRIGALMT